MTRFWMDQVAAWSVVIFSIYYASQLSRDYLIPLFALLFIAAILSYYLCFMCTWDKENPVPHAAFHGIACLGIHCVIAGI